MRVVTWTSSADPGVYIKRAAGSFGEKAAKLCHCYLVARCVRDDPTAPRANASINIPRDL